MPVQGVTWPLRELFGKLHVLPRHAVSGDRHTHLSLSYAPHPTPPTPHHTTPHYTTPHHPQEDIRPETHINPPMSAPNPAPRGERQKANDQVDGEMNRFLQMVGAAHEQDMGVEALHAKLDETNSALLKGFDEFILAAREGGLAKTERGEDWRKQGNDAFKKKSYEQAVLCYTRALHDLSDPTVLAAVLNNRATCLFHMELYRHAVVDAAEAVNLAPAYLKAYYRRGHALVKLGHTAEGEADIAITTPEDVATADESSGAAGGRGGGGGAVSAVEKVRAELASASRLRQVTVVEGGKVELKESFEEGRHLVAKKTLNPGDVVVSEDAYAAGLRPEHLLTHCEWCLQHTPNIYTARHFSSTSSNPTSSAAVRSRGLYCSADCAEAATASYVALEQTHPFFLICPLDCLVALRVMVARRQTSAGVETVNKLGGRTGDALPALLDSLEGHTHETEQTLSIGGNETANAVLAYHSGVLASVLLHGKGAGVGSAAAEGDVGSADAASTVSVPELWEAANELRRTMQQLITNGVGVSKLLKLPSPAGVENKTPVAAAMHAVEQRKVATALFPHVALVNHSCDPNCFLNFEGGPHTAFRRVHLRVTRLITPGEQLTICYGPHKNKIHSAKNRREALQNQYSFLCHCASCHEELDEPV